MRKILIGWEDDGKWHTTITVDGGTILRIEPPKHTPTSAERNNGSKIIMPTNAEVQHYSKKYAGDMIADGLAKLGAKPCKGCNKRKKTVNRADKWLRNLWRRSA